MISTWISSTCLARRLTDLEQYLVSGGGPWCVSGDLTWVDFYLWEVLDQHRRLIPGCLETLDWLKQWMDRFSTLPSVSGYLSRPTYRPFPIWSVRSRYGYQPLHSEKTNMKMN